MAPIARRRQWIGLIVLGLIATAGCNPLSTMAYFMTLTGNPQVPAECPLTRNDKKPVKVVILASTGLETRQELIGADRELAGLLAAKLQEGCKADRKSVV